MTVQARMDEALLKLNWHKSATKCGMLDEYSSIYFEVPYLMLETIFS